MQDGIVKMATPSFVITVWSEPTATTDGPEWRWRITRVDTGERKYFRRLKEVLEYISAASGLAPPA